MKSSKLLFLCTVAAGLLLAACGPQNAPQVWIDTPLNNSSLTAGKNEIAAHGAFETGIKSMWVDVGPIECFGYGCQDSFDQFDEDYDPPHKLEQEAPGLAIVNIVYDLAPGVYKITVTAVGVGSFNNYVLGEAVIEVIVCDPGENGYLEQRICISAVLEDITVTPAILPVPELIPIAIPNRNANCRLGPSSSFFDIVDTLFMGMEYMPVGQGPDMMWLLFEGPAYGGRCWVFIDNLDLFCSDEMVEIADISPCTMPTVNYPPFPTPTFTPEPEEPTNTPGPRLPECSDGIDNDSDGDIDLADGRCTSPDDDSESG